MVFVLRKGRGKHDILGFRKVRVDSEVEDGGSDMAKVRQHVRMTDEVILWGIVEDARKTHR